MRARNYKCRVSSVHRKLSVPEKTHAIRKLQSVGEEIRMMNTFANDDTFDISNECISWIGPRRVIPSTKK